MLWLRAIDAMAIGSVLASVIISLWQGAFLASLSRTSSGLVIGQYAMPVAALAALDTFRIIHVPLGIWLALVAILNILEDEASPLARLLGNVILALAAVFTPHDVSSVGSRLWDLVWVVAVATVTVSRRRWSLFLGFAGVLVGAMASLAYSFDPLRDGLTSLVAGLWLYVFIWYHKRHRALVEQREQQAFYDALTGALTRYGWADWYAQWPEGRQPEGTVVAADLDDFKWVNDTYGHGAGDTILKQFSTRIQHVAPSNARVVRWGGDEFQIWIPGLDAASAPPILRRMHRAVTEDGYGLDSGRINMGVSMGYAVGRLAAETADLADQALLRAKRLGKNQVQMAGVDPDAPPADGRAASAALGWLAGAVQSLWGDWDKPAVLTNAHGDVLYRNAAYASVAGTESPLKPSLPDRPAARQADALYARLRDQLARGHAWRGLVEKPGAGDPRWMAETIVPVKQGGQVVGYWATVDDVSSSPADQTWDSSVLDGTDIEIVFQPIVELASEECLGFEALARPSRNGAPWAPVEFFRLADRVGQIVAADLACLSAIQSTLSQIDWPSDCQLFVNVHPSTLIEGDFRSVQRAFWNRFPEVPVAWELAERGDRRLTERARHAVGMTSGPWVMDDFGVGDADAWRLTVWPWSWIKLDRSLVGRLPKDEGVVDLLKSLVEWAHARNIRVVAEGIETEAERDKARAIGVDAGQGFLWSRPSSWETVGPPAQERHRSLKQPAAGHQ